jgi:hypothetical protein
VREAHIQETLSHVHDGLKRRSGGSFVDDRPECIPIELVLSSLLYEWNLISIRMRIPTIHLDADQLLVSQDEIDRGGCPWLTSL